MQDSETHIYGPRAYDKNDKRVSVHIRENGCVLQLWFADLSGEGPVLEQRLLPDNGSGGLEPHKLREFVPRSPLYVSYARAALQFRRGDALQYAAHLRDVGGPRRGHTDEFYRQIARDYKTLIDEGEKHPVKALAAMHRVVISAASKWLSTAREKGLVDDAS
jgi:hypothetical protein